MAWGARCAAMVVVVGAALSGCGGANPLPQGSAEPSASPSASAAATPSSSPSSSAEPTSSAAPDDAPTAVPTAPASAAERTAVGAQSFARYYVDVVNRAFATGETKALTELTAKGCKTCANWLYNIEQVYGAGGRIRGGLIRVDSSSAAAPTQTARVDVSALVSEETDLDAKGKVLQTFPAAKGLLVFTLTRVDGGWQVSEIRLAGLQ